MPKERDHTWNSRWRVRLAQDSFILFIIVLPMLLVVVVEVDLQPPKVMAMQQLEDLDQGQGVLLLVLTELRLLLAALAEVVLGLHPDQVVVPQHQALAQVAEMPLPQEEVALQIQLSPFGYHANMTPHFVDTDIILDVD
jgi:hypothetical protein